MVQEVNCKVRETYREILIWEYSSTRDAVSRFVTHIFCLFDFWSEGQTQWCSGLTPNIVLRNYSWQRLGIDMWWHKLNLAWPHASVLQAVITLQSYFSFFWSLACDNLDFFPPAFFGRGEDVQTCWGIPLQQSPLHSSSLEMWWT